MAICTNRKVFAAEYLGVVPYDIALKLQHRLTRARAEGNVPDVLLLLEHTPVFTLGWFRGEEDIIGWLREYKPSDKGLWLPAEGLTYLGETPPDID